MQDILIFNPILIIFSVLCLRKKQSKMKLATSVLSAVSIMSSLVVNGHAQRGVESHPRPRKLSPKKSGCPEGYTSVSYEIKFDKDRDSTDEEQNVDVTLYEGADDSGTAIYQLARSVWVLDGCDIGCVEEGVEYFFAVTFNDDEK
jgi:hypothetical protein